MASRESYEEYLQHLIQEIASKAVQKDFAVLDAFEEKVTFLPEIKPSELKSGIS